MKLVWSGLGFTVPLGLLLFLSGPEIGREVGAAPAWTLAGALAAHLATLACRAEAWRLAVNAIAGGGIARARIHAACAAGLAAGAVQAAAVAPVRAFALRRLAPSSSPRYSQTLVAEGPVLASEALLSTLLLALGALSVPALTGLPSWVPFAGFALSVAALIAMRITLKRVAERRLAAGLNVLGDRRRRGAFLALVVGLTGFGLVRSWILLAGFGLPHDLASLAIIFATLGVFGTLPFGPAATAGAMVTVFGTVDATAAAAAGLALAATSILAVTLYGGLALGWLALAADGDLATGTRLAARRA